MTRDVVLEEKRKKQIEIVSLILAAAILVGLACAVLVCWMCHPGSGAAATAFLLIHFGTSCWLFYESDDPKANTVGVWALLRLVAGIFAKYCSCWWRSTETRPNWPRGGTAQPQPEPCREMRAFLEGLGSHYANREVKRS